ncbi:MAG: YggU family protein [Proteobacteria bacterium]|nr:YggU family protein [Pseudomonadota bacterium]NOG60619.1 YggU family protein [Pseudomonadota bacterium]
MSFYDWQDKNLLLKLHVQPRAKENSIVGIYNDNLKLKIKSPPVENKANKEIASYLAKEFSVTKSNVELISGQLNRDKKFLVKGVNVLPEWFKDLTE